MAETEREPENTDVAPASEGEHAPAEESSPSMGGISRLRGKIVDVVEAFDSPLKRIAAGATALILVGGLLGWWLWAPAEESPEQKLHRALRLLKDESNRDGRQEALQLAREVREIGYRDPDFAGAAEYVLGMVFFREAREADETEKERLYRQALQFLRECEQQALIEKYRPSWSFAMGVSLFETGNLSESRLYLEESEQTYPPGQTEARQRLVQIYLESHRADLLKRGLLYVQTLLKQSDWSAGQRDRLLLQKTRLHLALGQRSAAERTLQRISDNQAGSTARKVFRAMTRMAAAEAIVARRELAAVSPALRLIQVGQAAEQFRIALRELRPASQSIGLDTTFSRQAMYLMGLCAQRVAELEENDPLVSFDKAVNYYERTLQRFPQTQEAVAAAMRAAGLLRRSGRDEEALQMYQVALNGRGNSAEYRNRWIAEKEFQSLLQQAWNEWMERQSYSSAIELARMAKGILPEGQRRKWIAVASQEWARQMEKELEEQPAKKNALLLSELQRRWRMAGEAYSRLAEHQQLSPRYADYLWLSAENYRRGHDFEKALEQFTLFINALPKKNLPIALVMRGRVLMDLDRLPEAKEHFEQVNDLYPTDAAAFEARYRLGQCLLEMGQPDKAEQVWRQILSSHLLTPEANEWRLALFSLGEQLYHSAKIRKEEADALQRDGKTADARKLRDEAAARWHEAVLKLKEYLGRYPQTPEAIAARFLLYKALQQQAGIHLERAAEAEVEKVRNDHRRTAQNLLQEVTGACRQLQSRLLQEEEAGRLTPLHRIYLRDCYFDMAHAYYTLQEFRKAIDAYTAAANRYPQDPHVLLAYLQMANCNRQLGDATEALSLIVQAEVIFQKLPDSVFRPPATSLTRQEWQNWIQWVKNRQLADNRSLSP